MIRVPAIGIALVLALSDVPDSMPAPAPPQVTAKQPVLGISMDTSPLRTGASVLAVKVDKVVNPGLSALSVSVSALAAGTGSTGKVVIGTFSLYPADQPGLFHLALPPELARRLRNTSKTQLELRLGSGSETPLPQNVVIQFGKIQLVRPPGQTR